MNNKADFAPHEGETVKMKLQCGTSVEMKLVEVADLEACQNAPEEVRKDLFILLFRGPKEHIHMNGIVECQIADKEPFALGLMAEAELEDEIQYNAIFN